MTVHYSDQHRHILVVRFITVLTVQNRKYTNEETNFVESYEALTNRSECPTKKTKETKKGQDNPSRIDLIQKSIS